MPVGQLKPDQPQLDEWTANLDATGTNGSTTNDQ